MHRTLPRALFLGATIVLSVSCSRSSKFPASDPPPDVVDPLHRETANPILRAATPLSVEETPLAPPTHESPPATDPTPSPTPEAEALSSETASFRVKIVAGPGGQTAALSLWEQLKLDPELDVDRRVTQTRTLRPTTIYHRPQAEEGVDKILRAIPAARVRISNKLPAGVDIYVLVGADKEE